jgi:adenylate cyclase
MPEEFGQLIPSGGGDPIPLLSKKLRVGRREGCDIVLQFANISSHHCLLDLEEGFWFVRDLKSRNGIKVNGKRVPLGLRKRVDPNDTISFAKHEYRLEYSPHKLGAVGTPPQDEQVEDVMQQSLLERAGLTKRKS